MKKILSMITVFSMIFTVILSFPSPARAENIKNLSVGKPYTNVRLVNPTYPDTDNRELTDGISGAATYSDTAWSGTNSSLTVDNKAYNKWPLYTTVIDLERVCSVTEVYANFLNHESSGVRLPRGVRMFASLDHENWMELGYLNNLTDATVTGVYTYGWRYENGGSYESVTDVVDNNNSPVKARYIRYDFEKVGSHNFIDEITVMGYEGEVSGATAPTNTSKLEEGEILTVSEENTGNIQDMVLIYNQSTQVWSPDAFKPYATYVDIYGNSVDTFYDSFLFLALSSLNGRVFDNDNDIVKLTDWQWYLERTFEGENSDVNNLNKALIKASEDLGKRVEGNYVVMIPYPSKLAVEFGELDGRSLDLSKDEDAKFVIDWYIDEVLNYIKNNDYSHLNFKGFYWVHENASARMNLIQYANHLVDQTGYKSYWIPYYSATGYLWNEDLGFDALTLQPNHFFQETSDDTFGGGGTKMIENVAKLAGYRNFGVEIEFDGNLTRDVDTYNRGLDYLNGAVKMGFDGSGYFRNWYEGGGALGSFAYSKNPFAREFYDNVYELINGTYTPREYITSLETDETNLLLGKTYTHNGTNWYADRSADTNSTFLTDGVTGGRYYGNDYYGVKGYESPVIKFDFSDNPITLNEIYFNIYYEADSGVYLPDVKVFYQPEKNSNWEQIYIGEVTKTEFLIKSENSFKAYGLKFEFIPNGSFTFIKEIMAFDRNKNIAVNDMMTLPSELGKNISVGKKYTATRYVDPLYPDTGNKELTDGVLAEFDDNDAWTGTVKGKAESGMAYDVWPLYTAVIDLEKVHSVASVRANFLRDTAREISLPQAVRIYLSEDGENWMKLSYLSNIKNSGIGNGIFTYGFNVTQGLNGIMNSVTDKNVKARYVRLDFEPYGSHNVLDEITVIGSEEITSETLPLTNLTKLENGEVMKVCEETGFIRDMALCYQHGQKWTKDMFKPIITYIDKNNNSQDLLFDAILFLAQNNNGNRVYDTNNDIVTINDWYDYLELTFGEGGSVDALNEAAQQASIDLNDPDYKTKYVVMIPFPANSATNFGTLNGRALNLSKTEDTKYLLDWYIDTVCKYVENSDCDYLDFKGFYWMNEYPSRPDMIAYANDVVRESGYKSYWIPYFNSVGYFWREDLGFDALTLQPNHFFKPATENTLGAGGTKIIGTVAKLGAYGNFGVEMEFNTGLMASIEDYNKGLDYLNGAVEYGFDGPSYFRNWYLGNTFINAISSSKLPDSRKFYDYVYELMNGTYEIKPYITKMNENLLLGLSYTHNVNAENWYAERATDTNYTFLTDGLAGGNFYGNDYLGVKHQDVTVEMNFTEEKSIKEIHLDLLEDISAALNLPKNVDIYSKQDNNWVLVYSGDVPVMHTILRFDRAFSSEGLKFEFTRDGAFLFIKELMAFDTDSDITSDVDVKLPPLKGDINYDGVVDKNDITLFKRYFAGYDEVINNTASDVNKDGKITRADLVALLKLI